MHEALFYEKLEEDKVRCGLCRFRCLIPEGKKGICSVRENRGGILYSLVYGRLVAENVDPVEKKPLFHFLPGSRTYSIATRGCNFRCLHCQNYQISQNVSVDSLAADPEVTPGEIVDSAIAAGCRSISYTYTEPTIFYEFAYDTAKLAHERGLKNIFVTNGYITPEALAYLAPYLDAANIDLKGFTERFYRDVAHAVLAEVLDSIVAYKKHGIWIELTTLLIPGLNDSAEELRDLARFIVDRVGPDTPWHVTQFYPTYKLQNVRRTPIDTLRKARQIGLDAGIRYVYEGNVPGEGGENTFCPRCHKPLVVRFGFRVESNLLAAGDCPACAMAIAGLWRDEILL